MKCIYCNTNLAAIDYCPGCGADVTLLKRIGRISNLLYNRGLEKASVRDLSGAIGCLQQSLKFNKENIDARNLLGLCFYETGEVVSALCEWVISKNMCPDDNPADRFIDQLQNNKNQLDAINQSIRKYNQSIEYCRDGHEDMAVMQLKKVVAQNPKLVKAQQLLALLHMKHQDYEKARRVLKKAASIDNTNTTTLRYLSEIEEVTGRTNAFGGRLRSRDRAEQETGGTLRYVSGTETIIAPTTFRDSSTVATFINIGLGVLLGGAIVWFMAVPATRQSIQESANRRVTDANLQLASGTAQLQDLQDQIAGYEADVDDANKERDDALSKADSYDELLGIANTYINGEYSAAGEAIGKVDARLLDGNAKKLYDNLTQGVSGTLFDEYYTAGTTAYVSGDYQTAAEQLKLAVEADPDDMNVNAYNALLYLAFAYYNSGDYTNSNKYFNQLIEKYPDKASTVQGYLVADSSSGQSQDTTQGEASMQQGDAGNTDNSGTQTQQTEAVTIVDDSGQYSGGGASYNEADVAWTDPNTGLHYDAWGNLLG